MNEIAFLDLNEISLQSLSPMLSMMVFALFYPHSWSDKKGSFRGISTVYFASSLLFVKFRHYARF